MMKKLFWILLLSFAVGMALFYFLIESKVQRFSESVRPGLRSVLVEIYKSKLFGGYWENQLILQIERAKSLAPWNRAEFYGAIIIYSDLDTSRAYLFVTTVGRDSAAIEIMSSDKYISSIEMEDYERHEFNEWFQEINRVRSLFELDKLNGSDSSLP
ncbi:hypothetical protein [uncultured Microbulbifer sp.]|uniref:hypothetical protein n=1 Tax=uncultured Microbulbifer sp. TaxID=348147 RepID=UPI0026231BD3|nr:hypothetical protein [uncultured Microbulbifer sp.]